MNNNFYDQICLGVEVRSNLQSLRTQMKDPAERTRFAAMLNGDYSVLISLLDSDDPKIRRNTVQILGFMESEELLPVLFRYYERELTRYIRTDYLEAMEPLDFEEYLPALNERLHQLAAEQDGGENQKHRRAEMQQIKQMLLIYEPAQRHTFIGMDYTGEVVLTTNHCQREATQKQLPKGKTVLLRGGVRVKDVPLGEILPIRTYLELLIPVGMIPAADASGGPERMGTCLARLGIDQLMQKLYSGNGTCSYRIDCKLAAGDDRGDWIRRLSSAFEDIMGLGWVNNPSDYEIEIRLIPRKDNSWLVMLHPGGLAEQRFSYRKETISASIAPSTAALIAELARPWLKEDAQVLDPFCGVGTMLVERAKAGESTAAQSASGLQAGESAAAGEDTLAQAPKSTSCRVRSMYGLDISADAFRKAHANISRSGVTVNLIHRDFFTFKHEYLFDEVITDMPQVTRECSRERLAGIYRKFFTYVRSLLKPESVLVLYATEPDFVETEVKKCAEYRIAASFPINERAGTAAFVIERKENPMHY